MKPFSATRSGAPPARRRGENASARIVLLFVVFLLAGLGVGAYWFFSGTRAAEPEAAGAGEIALSGGTLAVLQRLDSPVEIRFYSLLDPASTSDALRAFAARVDRLLSAYERAADGKIKIVRNTAPSDTAANAASADGLQPFNLDKGDACFLGIVAARGAQKETLGRLSPEWEAALEPDLSRAIERLASVKPGTTTVAAPPRLDPAAVEEVKRAIPDLAAVSLDDGSRILRESALAEFTAAAREMQSQLKEAQQHVSEAQAGGSEADRQAALKHLQDVQAAQAEKLQQIAARSQAQIEAFQQLKKDAH